MNVAVVLTTMFGQLFDYGDYTSMLNLLDVNSFPDNYYTHNVVLQLLGSVRLFLSV